MESTLLKLTALAHERLIADLIKFGNVPSEAQSKALHNVLETYSRIALGELSGRWAHPLPTGTGKTRSIIAWVWAVTQLGLTEASTIITASKVEALCTLKRDLIGTGVPEQSIGLVHSFKYDKQAALNYLEGDRELPSGYASEPCTEDQSGDSSRLENRPYLLCTHQRIRGKNGIEPFNVYNGKPRSLVIWDESLLASETFAFADDIIASDIGAIAPLRAGWTPERDEALEYLRTASDIIQNEMSLQKQDPERKPRSFKLGPLSGEDVEKYKQAMTGHTEAATRLRDLLDISQEDLRVLANVAQGGGVITFRVSVPKELSNIVVLDASFPIRELAKLDPSIKQADCADNIVTYESVTVYQMDHGSGRSTMEREFSRRRGYNKVAREVAEVIKGIPDNQAVLLFTFKMKGKLHYQRLLERELESNGIDIEAEILINGELKPRLNFLTWGQETSLNQYSFCSNVILVGLLQRSHIDIGSSIAGQTGDLLRPISNSEIREVLQSEIAHSAYQALSRGSSRVINAGKASPLNVWLFHPEREDLKGHMAKVLPGVTWKKWEPLYLPTHRSNQKAEPLAMTIKAYLDKLRDEGVEKVSLRQLKADLHLCENNRKTAQRATQKAVESTGGQWVLRGRTAWQAPTWFFSAATEVRTAVQPQVSA
jgi:hypothetical protein